MNHKQSRLNLYFNAQRAKKSTIRHEEFFAIYGSANDAKLVATAGLNLMELREEADAPFIPVSRPKRARDTKPSEGGAMRQPQNPLLHDIAVRKDQRMAEDVEGTSFAWKDPFGASGILLEVNAATNARFPSARTKQSARQHTSTGRGRFHLKSNPFPSSGSSGSASDRSRARL